MADVIVRAMEPEDAEAVAAIHNQRAVARDTLQIPYQTVNEQRERFGQSATRRLLVAELEGFVVGVAGLHLYSGRRAHAGSLGMGVREECQGRGVGTALLRAILDLADNWYNLRRVELEVYADNESAIRLYRKHGFMVEGTHRAYAYRDGDYVDALSMARLRNDPSVVADREERP